MLPPSPFRKARSAAFAAATALAAAVEGAAPADAQMFRTVATVGGAGEPDPIGTVVSFRVHPHDGRVRIVGDSGRVHVFTARGRRAADTAGFAEPRGEELVAEVAPGVRVRATAGAAGFRIVRNQGGDSGVLDDRSFLLPSDREAAGSAFTVRRILADGAGRAWLLVCPAGDGCGEQERWLIARPPASPDEAPDLTVLVLPVRFRLEAVRGSLLYGVQGVPGRHMLHLLELYEREGR